MPLFSHSESDAPIDSNHPQRERELFGQLSVFAGGFTLEAAEAGSGIGEDDVLDLLSRLVEKSLVVAEAGAQDASRYRMLDPVGQYARERLEESGKAEEVRRRHASHGVRPRTRPFPLPGPGKRCPGQLDEAAWQAAWAQGRAMTPEQAIEYALSEEMEPPTLVPERRPPAEGSIERLTRREREVALLIAQGLTNPQIASELSVSRSTANNHVARILRKLGLHSRAQIATWVTERRSPSS